ncbi:MAG: DUF6728 family protein [Bacteroidia bacterium]|nr:hypothetical protein [Bacteroidota bacterium]
MSKFLRYFVEVFRPGGAHRSGNFNLRMMHGINRISILMFIAGVLVLVFRSCTRG